MRTRWVVAGLAASVTLTGCAASPGADPAARPETLTVLAASSLTDSLTQLAARFEADHPGVTVRPAIDGSASLVTQLEQGAPADVVAVADEATMDRLVAAGLVGSPLAFASNALVIAVPADNPAHITSWTDLARPGVTTVRCAPAVPCGAAADRLEAVTHVTPHPVSYEQNVKAVVTKLTTRAADAGLVFATDVIAAAGQLVAVALPDGSNVDSAARTTYVAAVVASSPAAERAAQFVAYLGSSEGQAILTAAGFGPALSQP